MAEAFLVIAGFAVGVTVGVGFSVYKIAKALKFWKPPY